MPNSFNKEPEPPAKVLIALSLSFALKPEPVSITLSPAEPLSAIAPNISLIVPILNLSEFVILITLVLI